MKVSSATDSAALSRIKLANTTLSAFLRTGLAAAGRTAAGESRATPLTTALSPAVQSDVGGPSSLAGLLSPLSATGDSISGTRDKLGQVRRQLETILEAAGKARQRRGAGDDPSANERIIKKAIAEIARLTGEGDNGAAASPAAAPIIAIAPPDPTTKSTTKTVTISAAQAASLSYDGNASGFDSGTFLITGNAGTGSVVFNAGTSLASLATLVNQKTGTTGVTAAVEDNQLVFRSSNTGSSEEISVSLALNQLSVSGVNASQVAAFDVVSFDTIASHTINGTVTATAKKAEQSLVGQNGRITDKATFDLTGNLGTATIAVQAGELLSDVAARVNQQTATTGVIATVNGNNLVFNSLDIGSSAQVAIEVKRLEAVRGVNSSQVTGFQIASIAENSSTALSGSVTTKANRAQLKHTGTAGLVTTTATFNVGGNQGTAAISVSVGETLGTVAARVNAQTANTGVTASVVGNDLFFNSVGYGTAASASVVATSGIFNVTGGSAFGNGRIAYGTNAVAQINGVSYTGSGNQFTLNLASGSFVIDFAAEFQGSFNKITAFSASVNNSVNVSGVNATQVAGFQVNAIQSGDTQTIAGDVRNKAERATLKYSGDSGAVTKDAANINVAGTLGTASFTIVKGESLSGVASRINQQSGATGVTATVVNNDLFLDSTAFGASQSVFVKVVSGKFDVSGGTTFNDGKIDYGTNVKVAINGTDYFGVGNQLTYSQGTGSFTFDFKPGFEGNFNPITVAATIGADNLTDGAHANAAGVNRSQIAGFQINSSVANTIQTVSGNVIDVAERGQLKYSGSSGQIRDNATFELAGDLGSVLFTVTANEQLSAVAGRINQQTGATGITATVVGNDLFLNSTAYGASASVFVKTTSGTFDVSGGSNFNGGKIDYGTNVKAKINGVDYFGTGNQLTFGDASGNFTINFAAGFSGTFNTVSVGSFTNAFNLQGGNGNGTANGTDALAVINGQSLVATANRFDFSDALGSYSLNAVAGFTGSIDPITVERSESPYVIGGGNGDGTANGSDEVLGEVVVVTKIPPPPSSSEPTVPAVLVAPVARRAANVQFAVVDGGRNRGSFSLGLDISTLGGSAGTLDQLLAGPRAGRGAFADKAESIAEQALAYVTNIESLLDQTAGNSVRSSSEVARNPAAGNISRSVLAIRSLASQSTSGAILSQFRSEPRRVLDLLR